MAEPLAQLNALEWDGFQARVRQRLCLKNGQAAILTMLVRHPGRTFAATCLADLVRVDEGPGPRDRSIAAYVSNLRGVLEDLGQPRCSISHTGAGYVLSPAAAAAVRAIVLGAP